MAAGRLRGGVMAHPARVVLYSTLRMGLQGSGFFPALGCLPKGGGVCTDMDVGCEERMWPH